MTQLKHIAALLSVIVGLGLTDLQGPFNERFRYYSEERHDSSFGEIIPQEHPG